MMRTYLPTPTLGFLNAPQAETTYVALERIKDFRDFNGNFLRLAGKEKP